MSRKSFEFVATALVTTLAGVLVACGSYSANTPTTLTPTSPDPGVASSLDVSIIVGEAEPQMGYLNVSVTFSRGGRAVLLANGDSVSCNGLELEPGLVPLQPQTYSNSSGLKRADSAYVFTYRHSGNSTSVQIASLVAPSITSPRSGATLDRRAGLTMTYEPARGGQVTVMIYQTTADDSLVLGGPEKPDTGTYTFDSSMLTPLKPGPGWAWLELHQQVKSAPPDTGFQSVAIINNAALSPVQIRLL